MMNSTSVEAANLRLFTKTSGFSSQLKWIMLGVSATALLLALPAYAQSADPEDAPKAVTGKIEIVIVTAQKKKENLQKTPVSVSALSALALQEKGVSTLQDLSASVPGFVVASTVNYGSAPLSIRGVGGANGGGNVFADEPVAVYVDDAVIGRLRMSTADLLDIGGVEVLRGPQGTLYGRNSTAGAILIHSAEPTRHVYGYAKATLGSFGTEKFAAAVSGPLTSDGSLLGRLAVSSSKSDGFGINSFDGSHIGGSKNLSSRGYLKWHPVEGLTFDLIAEHVDMQSNPALIAVSDVSQLKSASNPTGTNTVYPYTLRSNLNALIKSNHFAQTINTFTKTKGSSLTLKGNLDLGHGYNLTSISNYRDWYQNGQQDSTVTGVVPVLPIFVTGSAPAVGYNKAHNVDSQFSEEVRLSYDNKGKWTWMLGGFLWQEKNKIAPISIFNYLAGPGGAGTDVTFNAGQTTQAWALFANATYQATDKLSLTFGGRYSEEKKAFYDYQTVSVINTFDPPGPAIFVPGQTLAVLSTTPSASWHNISPRIVANYQFTSAIMGYASYSKGFKSGGFNAFNATPASAFKPEGIAASEVGLKSDLYDHSVRLNLAAFNYDYTNLQVRTPVPTGGVGIETADAAYSRGIEAEGNWYVTKDFRIDANLSYLNAKFTKGLISGVPAASFVFGTNPTVVKEDIAGNHLSRAPEWQGSLSGRYSWNIPAGQLTLVGNYRYQGDEYFLETEQAQPTYHAKAWSQIDTRLTLASSSDHWDLSAYVNNLTDQRHLSQVTAFFALPVASVNEPRSIGLQLNVKY